MGFLWFSISSGELQEQHLAAASPPGAGFKGSNASPSARDRTHSPGPANPDLARGRLASGRDNPSCRLAWFWRWTPEIEDGPAARRLRLRSEKPGAGVHTNATQCGARTSRLGSAGRGCRKGIDPSVSTSRPPRTMPMEPLSVALALCLPVAFLAGALVMRAVCRRKYEAERAALEHEMTAEIQERYAAYVAPEKQMRRIFLRLDALEVKTQRSLENTGVHLRALGNVLSAYEGKAPQQQPAQPTKAAPAAHIAPPGNAADEALSWMSELDEHIKVYGDGEELPAAAPAAAAKVDDIAQWERKLETLREEKRAEIDRQGQVIAELTERLQRLQ